MDAKCTVARDNHRYACMKDSSSNFQVTLRKRPDGKTQIFVGATLKSLSAELPDSIPEMNQPGSLHGSVTPPRRKLAGATWFLSQLRKCLRNEAAALLFLETFLSELRASTFALQKLLVHVDGFTEWYEERQGQMRADALLRWLVEARNAAQKQGLVFAEWSPHPVVQHYKDGRVQVVESATTFEVEGFDRSVTTDDLAKMLSQLSAVVEEAHDRFLPSPPARPLQLSIELVRERDDGAWEHFDP